MKRLVVVLSGLLILPAFAEVAPIYYDDAIEMYDADDIAADVAVDEVSGEILQPSATQKAVAPTVPTARNTGGRTASRAVPSGNSASVAPTRTVSSRGTSARTSGAATTARTTTSRATTARTAVSRPTATGAAARSAASGATTINNVRRATGTAGATQARAGTSSSIVQTDTVNTPLYTGRVGVRTNVSARIPTVRVATGSVTATAETTTSASATADMDELAQVTDFCKAQYTQCMDNFCNVLDDNQGRCSCSANLKNYEKTEAALKQATEDLQDVAQKIQYIGLSSNEIETLFAQTEAEITLQQKGTDNTQLKNDLDKIKKLIVDVKGGTATVSDSGISMDLSGLLDFSISSTGFDLSSLLGNSGNNSTISNQRGEQLYKTATARCKASVLNSCAAQGVDTALIANSYDLEIDKQCIAYERSLTDSNDQMVSTVRNAKSVLQKARLMVAQNKNSYDLRGCISALDSCMQDEFVCGSDYENCLDPTGKYIVNGEIVAGSQPGLAGGEYNATGGAYDGLYKVWDYDSSTKNVWGGGNISTFVNKSMYGNASEFNGSTADLNMAQYLQRKIGYIGNDGIAKGMCASVLNKCQNYTYDGKGNNQKYAPNNQVVREYLERAMIQIKASQDSILADHAEDCIADVASCLSQNSRTNYTGAYSVVAQGDNYSNVAIRACMAQINTCRSVTQSHTQLNSDVYAWLDEAVGTTYQCTQKGGDVENGYCKLTITSTTYYIDLSNGVLYTMDATGKKTPVSSTACPTAIAKFSGNACVVVWSRELSYPLPADIIGSLQDKLGTENRVLYGVDGELLILNIPTGVSVRQHPDGNVSQTKLDDRDLSGVDDDKLREMLNAASFSAVEKDVCEAGSGQFTASGCLVGDTGNLPALVKKQIEKSQGE